MSFFKNIKAFFGGETKKRSPAFDYIIRNQDPTEIWEIVGELGDGSFGKVYKTQNKETGKFAALKQVEVTSDEELDDYLVEIEILKECAHEYIVGLYQAFLFGDKLWMYIEYCAGGAVDSIMLDLEKPLTESQCAAIGRQMIEALGFLHERYVIHRDLKAGNVLLTMDGKVKLADFGVSVKNSDTRQKCDSFIGTPYWMAPEVIMCETVKDNPYSSKADIWSFGITMLEFAQMMPPNHEMHPMRVLIRIQKADPPSFDNPRKWSANFRDLITKCLKKNPDDRPTASELLNHPFIANKSNKPILDLLSEAKAEVMVTETEVDDTAAIKGENDSNAGDLEGDNLSLSNVSSETEPSGKSDSPVLSEQKKAAPLPPAPPPLPPPAPVPVVVVTEKKQTVVEPEVKREEKSAEVKEKEEEEMKPSFVRPSDIKTKVALEVVARKDAPTAADREELIVAVADQVIDDVLLSVTTQPSVPGVVLQCFNEVISGEIEVTTSATQSVAERRSQFEGAVVVAPNIVRKKTPPVSPATTENKNPQPQVAKASRLEEETQEKHMYVGDEETRVTRPNSEFTINGRNVSERKEAVLINGKVETGRGRQTSSSSVDGVVRKPSSSSPPVTPTSTAAAQQQRYKKATEGATNGVAMRRDGDGTSTINRQFLLKNLSANSLRSTVFPFCGSKENKSQYRTMTKVRRYMVDGQVVTTSTSRVVMLGEENKTREDHELRKVDLRELKLLQKVENRQYQELLLRAQYMREQQEKKCEQDMQMLLQNYTVDIEMLSRQQKTAVEKAESMQAVDLKIAAKKLKQDQEKEQKSFREGLKQEMKMLKQEVDMMPRDLRRDTLRRRKEEKEIHLSEKERLFMEQQQEGLEKAMKRLADQHREKVALLEKQFLQQKQQLLRAREAAIWELEEKQLHEKHQLAKRQLTDLFHLKRHQMFNRHEKELEQLRRIHARLEEAMLERHALEKKRLPKILKSETKTRQQQFKQSIRISKLPSADQEKDKIKQFDETEKRRHKAEQLRQELKHKKQWDNLKGKHAVALKELEHLQNEKRKLLLEHETHKMSELDTQYKMEVVEWKGKLRPRKQTLEEEFSRQLTEQERFYSAAYQNKMDTSTLSRSSSKMVNRPSTSM